MTWAIIACVTLSLASAQFTIQPQSTSVLLGQDATFSCAGKGLSIIWTNYDENVDVLGLEHTNHIVGDVRISNLTITGSAESNDFSIKCVLAVLYSIPLQSEPVFLTVLGIGQVPFIEFIDATHPPHGCIQWEEPSFISADVTDLMYNVSLSGADETTPNTTTNETSACPQITPCQEFIITVTPFSPFLGYVGASNSTTDYVDGGNYELEDPCVVLKVEFVDVDNVTCSFVCKVNVPTVACPTQFLSVMTTAKINESVIRSFSDVSLELLNGKETSIVISTTELPAGVKYYSTFSIKDLSGGVVDIGETNLWFSTHSVQNASFSQLPSANIVDVTCYFATNAFASACVAQFENASLGLAFNGTVDHPHGSLNSSGNVTVPQAVFQQQGEGHVAFDVKVFDVDENGNIAEKPAFEKNGALKVVTNEAETNSDTATHATASSAVIPTMGVVTDMESIDYVMVVVVVLVIAAIVIVAVLGLIVITLFYLLRRKKKQGRMEVSDSPRASSSLGSFLALNRLQTNTAVDTSSSITETPFTRSNADPLLPVSSELDASPVPTPPGINALVYKQTSKYLQRSDETDSSSASNVPGIQYTDVKHPARTIPNIREPPVIYTQLKFQRTYESRKHKGITPDPPPPLPAKKRKLQSLAKSAENQNSVPPPGRLLKGPREVVIQRPNTQTSFGFSVQSYTLRTGCMICRLTPGSPAEQCGQLQLYDELLSVNGTDVTRLDHDVIVQIIKASSVDIKLTVQRPKDKEEVLQMEQITASGDRPMQSAMTIPRESGRIPLLDHRHSRRSNTYPPSFKPDSLNPVATSIQPCS